MDGHGKLVLAFNLKSLSTDTKLSVWENFSIY